MTESKVSICITAQRFDLFFVRAVHSIKSQIKPLFEVVLAMDGISDQMSQARCYKELPEEWVKIWTEQENSGPSYTRNLGMHYCTGEWILFLDGDDFLVPSCLEFYEKHLLQTKADIITEFSSALVLKHQNLRVSKYLQDKNSWAEAVKMSVKQIFSGSWKRGDLPIDPLFVRNDGKKYLPLDYVLFEKKVLLLQYMLEERKILLSSYCSYVFNKHPMGQSSCLKGYLSHPDEIRFKKLASNVQINGWTVKEKIFEQIISSPFISGWDIDYIDKTASYLSID